MNTLSIRKSREIRPPSFRSVAGYTRHVGRFFHNALAALAAAVLGLALGSTCAPIPVASGQTLSGALSIPTAALEAHAENGDSALLPLVREGLQVRIDDGHAAARYEHVFQNESKARLEGNYRLLVGEGATATGFAYYNGERKIVGEIFERESARQVYEALTGLRRDPGLLEQAGEAGFAFRVFPIEPGEHKRVQVTTSRWLRRCGAFIEYRARLSRADASVVMTIRDARGIRSLESPTHDLKIDGGGADGAWNVTVLRPKTGLSAAPDDLVVRYEPAEPPLVLRATLHHDPGESSFLSMTFSTPPARTTPTQETVVRGGSDVTLVLDRSGSMEGASIESARNAAKAIVERLLPSDRANVIAFDDEVDALYPAPRALTDDVRRELLEYIGRIQAGGGTDIAKALSRALGNQIHDDHPDIVLFLTDGQSDGPAAVKVAAEDASNARVFTVGIGTGVDKALLSRLASIKHGRFTFIADPRAVAAEFPKVLSQLEDPVLTDVTLRAEGGAIERVYPQALGDLFPADELRVFGRSGSRQPFKVVLEGNERGAKRRFETTVDPTKVASEPWVAQSWARARVDDLLEETSAKGETAELKNEAIELGLAYGLVTPYTSFLAIPEAEMTEAAKSAVGSMRERRRQILTARTDAAALSRMNMPPGDPILRVHAPRDAARVTATFPFGLSQDLSYDEMSECWMTRFLVPVDVPDGTYEVRVVITLADGSVKVALAHYTIDSREPSLDVEAKAVNGGVDIRVMADEPALEARVAVAGDLRSTRSLAPQSDRRTFEGHLVLPPGRYRLRIVVADLARNESEREVDVVVPSDDAEPR